MATSSRCRRDPRRRSHGRRSRRRSADRRGPRRPRSRRPQQPKTRPPKPPPPKPPRPTPLRPPSAARPAPARPLPEPAALPPGAPTPSRPIHVRRQETAPVLLQRHHAPVGGAARRGARPVRGTRGADHALPEGAGNLRRRGRRRRRRRLHAGGAPVRRCRRGRRPHADDPLRQHPRDRRLVVRGVRRDPQDRRAAGAGRAARPGSGAGRELPVGGTDADRRTDGRGAALGQGACRTAAGHGPGDRAQHWRGAAGGAFVPGVFGHAGPARWLARGVRRELERRQPDRPRSVHPLQRVHQGLSRARDRLELPGRPRPLQEPPAPASPPAARRRRSTSRAATATVANASTSCSTCSARRRSGGINRRRAIWPPGPTRSRRRRRWPS